MSDDPPSSPIVVPEERIEGTDTKYYNAAADYWEQINPTIDGMLGGYGKISNVDIDGSAKFLKMVFKVFIYLNYTSL